MQLIGIAMQPGQRESRFTPRDLRHWSKEDWYAQRGLTIEDIRRAVRVDEIQSQWSSGQRFSINDLLNWIDSEQWKWALVRTK